MQVNAIDITTLYSPAASFTKFDVLVNVLVKNAFVLAGFISFVLLIFGAFGVIVGAGSGDTKKLEQGKQAIVGAVIGLVLIVASVWIIEILSIITGVNLLSPS